MLKSWKYLGVLVAALLLLGCSEGLPTEGESPGEPAALVHLSGDEQVGLAGVRLPKALAVKVTDEEGRAVSNAQVQWHVEVGDGTVSRTTSRTDNSGHARTRWTLGTEVAAQKVVARIGDLEFAFTATAEAPEVGASYYGRNDYTQYVAGDLPIIISASHGGTLRPGEIPDRTWGVSVMDLNTLELAFKMVEAIEERFGRPPHLIALHLHRSKLDANRDIEEAAQGNPYAEQAWYEYHDFTEVAKRGVIEEHGAAFYIDLHGHGHEIQRLELGYLLSASDLERSDEELDHATYINRSSIRTLVETSDVTFPELLRGPTSLGELYEKAGYPSVPSATQPDPGGNPYWSGGYNTDRHGSREGGPISGVQIEANFTGVRDTEENRRAFAEATAEILETFFAEHFGITLSE